MRYDFLRSGGWESGRRRPMSVPLTMCLGRSSTCCMRSGSTPLRSTPVAVRFSWVTIIGLITNGEAPKTSGSFSTLAITSRYSRNSLAYFRTSTCALTPSTFSRNCSRKPPVTPNTVTSAVVPSATPSMASSVPTETMARLREPMYRRARDSGKPMPAATTRIVHWRRANSSQDVERPPLCAAVRRLRRHV